MEQDRKALRRLGAAEQAFLQQLQDEPSESEDIENAVDFGCARWGGELLQALHSLPNLEEGFKRKFEKELRTQQNALWQISPSGAALQISSVILIQWFLG